MSDTLAWVAAVGPAAIIAAAGSWRSEITARWQARAERLRTDAARRENELHRMRHAELYQWWHDMPDGPARIKAMLWFGEYTGASDPYHGGAGGGPQTPGLHSGDASRAYDEYVSLLDAIYHPGRPGPAPRPISPPPGDTPAIPEPETASTGE